MPYAVEVYFDPEATRAITSVWQRIADAGYHSEMLECNAPPHVSLALYEKIDFPGFEQRLAAFVKPRFKFPIRFHGVSTFNTDEGVIYLEVGITKELMRLHADFHDQFLDYLADVSPYYVPGTWIPHCTMSMHVPPNQVAPIISLCNDSGFPTAVEAHSIGVIKYWPVRELFRFPLL